MKRTFLLLLMFLMVYCAMAQPSPRRSVPTHQNEGSILLTNFHYGGQLPGGDMAERFGFNFLAGMGLDYYTKNNWIVGINGDFLFGKKVKTDVLANLRSSDGLLFADDGGISDIKLRERGLMIKAHVGKVIPLSQANKRSGIKLTIGGGFLQHRIRIQDEPQVYVASLSDKDYKKGYDRLANGFALTQFIGYQYIAKNRLVNFSLGVDLVQGFTKGRRSFNFDTRSPGLEDRLDLQYGYRLTWVLPFFIGENPDEIYY